MEIKNDRGIFFINIDHVSHAWVPVDNMLVGMIYMDGGKMVECTAEEAREVGKMLWAKAKPPIIMPLDPVVKLNF